MVGSSPLVPTIAFKTKSAFTFNAKVDEEFSPDIKIILFLVQKRFNG